MFEDITQPSNAPRADALAYDLHFERPSNTIVTCHDAYMIQKGVTHPVSGDEALVKRGQPIRRSYSYYFLFLDAD